jgi:hypothetical protein
MIEAYAISARQAITDVRKTIARNGNFIFVPAIMKGLLPQ